MRDRGERPSLATGDSEIFHYACCPTSDSQPFHLGIWLLWSWKQSWRVKEDRKFIMVKRFQPFKKSRRWKLVFCPLLTNWGVTPRGSEHRGHSWKLNTPAAKRPDITYNYYICNIWVGDIFFQFRWEVLSNWKELNWKANHLQEHIKREKKRGRETQREARLCKWLTGMRNDESKINTGQATDKLNPPSFKGWH